MEIHSQDTWLRVCPMAIVSVCSAGTGRFITLWYKNGCGFTIAQVGTILATARTGDLFFTPFWSGLADKTQQGRLILLSLQLAHMLIFLSLPLSVYLTSADHQWLPLMQPNNRFLILWVTVAVWSAFRGPCNPLRDALALAALGKEKAKWGQQRLYGAVSWGIAHAILGLSMDYGGFAVLFILFTLSGAWRDGGRQPTVCVCVCPLSLSCVQV